MAEIQLEIEGAGAVAATEDLLQTPGLSGSWTPASEQPQREGVLATIATILGIAVATIEIAERIHKWYQHYSQRQDKQTIEKVVLVGRSGRRVLLSKATVEQIRQILDE